MAHADDFAIYYDSSLCIGCKACQVACKQWNQLPSPMLDEDYDFSGGYTYPPDRDGDNYLLMRFDEREGGPKGVEWLIHRDSCHHCTDAGCVKACPSGACHHEDNGVVVIDPEVCIGCTFCELGCPYHVPRFNERKGIETKCWLCHDRLMSGGEPACVKVCFPDALDFGRWEDMVAKAHARVEQIKDRYPDATVYGEHEMGGLHVIDVLTYAPSEYGLPTGTSGLSGISPLTQGSQLLKPATAAGVVAISALIGTAYLRWSKADRDTNRFYFDYDRDTTIDRHTGEPMMTGQQIVEHEKREKEGGQRD